MTTHHQHGIPKSWSMGFVLVSFIALEFCHLIFPALRGVFASLGASLAPLSEFSFDQCSWVENHLVASLGVLLVGYVLSLTVVPVKYHATINFLLLLYCAMILLGLGIPLHAVPRAG